jgi:ABC-2 type transport system permease protein
MMTRRLFGLMRKEMTQFFRDKMLVMLVLYTFVEIVICGWALTLEVRQLPTAIYDGSRSAASRTLRHQFEESEYFNVNASLSSREEIDPLLNSGQAALAVVIPADFEQKLQRGQPAPIQLVLDGANSNTAGQALMHAGDLLRDYNRQIAVERVGRRGQPSGLLPRVVNQVRVWYMPQLKYVHFIMLTMLAISVLLLGIILAAAGIVREREAGTLEQLLVTPIRTWELIMAKFVPLVGLKLVGLLIGVGLSVWLFGVPVRGSLLLFLALSVLMFLSSVALGVLIALVARNMQQTLLLSFFILFPVAFLSGTMVPISNMPQFMQWLTYLSPLTYYVTITLGIFLKGVGLAALWPQVLALAAYGLALLALSAASFRRSLARAS